MHGKHLVVLVVKAWGGKTARQDWKGNETEETHKVKAIRTVPRIS